MAALLGMDAEWAAGFGCPEWTRDVCLCELRGGRRVVAGFGRFVDGDCAVCPYLARRDALLAVAEDVALSRMLVL